VAEPVWWTMVADVWRSVVGGVRLSLGGTAWGAERLWWSVAKHCRECGGVCWQNMAECVCVCVCVCVRARVCGEHGWLSVGGGLWVSMVVHGGGFYMRRKRNDEGRKEKVQ